MHSAPRGKEPAGATMVDEGAGMGPWADTVLRAGTPDEEADPETTVLIDADAEEEAMKPLQRPCSRLQVLNAHCSSLVQEAWKLPQTV